MRALGVGILYSMYDTYMHQTSATGQASIFKSTCQCHRPNMSTTEPFGRLYLSPDGAVQTYVQHLIAQKHIKVWQFLRHPACHVYICGNSSMAEEVKAEVGLNHHGYCVRGL